jgi:hypothetical protein
MEVFTPEHPINSVRSHMKDKKVEDPKLVIVYFASGTVQWVKSGTTNQWARYGGAVHKFFEGRVYQTTDGRKVKIKQHFKLLNAVFMDTETGAFLDTTREDLLMLIPDAEDGGSEPAKWWDVDWSCPIVFEPKVEKEKKPYKPKSDRPMTSSAPSARPENPAHT